MWVTRADLARLADLSETRIDQLRKKFGDEFEHKKPLRIYAPQWLKLLWDEQGKGAEKDEQEQIRRHRRDRIEEIELRNKELDLGAREGSLVSVEDFLRDRLGPCLDEIRNGIELTHQWPDAQRILLDQLQVGIERLQANGSSHLITGNRKSRTSGGGKTSAKDSSKPS